MAVRTLQAARGSCRTFGGSILGPSVAPAKRRPLAWLPVCGILAAAMLCASGMAASAAVGTSGVFADRAGATHPWSVNNGHVLIWDGQPYIPVGGVFAPRYLAEGQTEDNWKKDADALEVIKSKGVTDLIVTPTVSAADVPAAAWQRVLDSLEAGGFRYGLEFGA